LFQSLDTSYCADPLPLPFGDFSFPRMSDLLDPGVCKRDCHDRIKLLVAGNPAPLVSNSRLLPPPHCLSIPFLSRLVCWGVVSSCDPGDGEDVSQAHQLLPCRNNSGEVRLTEHRPFFDRSFF